MYCPVEIISPLFNSEIKGTQRNEGVFVSPTMLYSIISLYNQRMYSYNVVRILKIMWYFSFHYNPCLFLL